MERNPERTPWLCPGSPLGKAASALDPPPSSTNEAAGVVSAVCFHDSSLTTPAPGSLPTRAQVYGRAILPCWHFPENEDRDHRRENCPISRVYSFGQSVVWATVTQAAATVRASDGPACSVLLCPRPLSELRQVGGKLGASGSRQRPGGDTSTEPELPAQDAPALGVFKTALGKQVTRFPSLQPTSTVSQIFSIKIVADAQDTK